AHLKIAQAYDKLRDEKNARRFYEATVKEFQRSGRDAKAAVYAAEAQFQIVERQFSRFRAISFDGTSRQQKQALTKKAEALKKVEDDYKAILGFKHIDWTLASLFRIGQLYQNFADSLVKAPCPPDVKK